MRNGIEGKRKPKGCTQPLLEKKTSSAHTVFSDSSQTQTSSKLLKRNKSLFMEGWLQRFLWFCLQFISKVDSLGKTIN
ncbi:uncharacterized protein J3R85_021049 [Psidium guajava]|nr:uncharacterized protein J3R85_021049 [Psidium guajava]